MKTLTVTAARQNLGVWLKRALKGEDIGVMIDGAVVAFRTVNVYSEDYAVQEYGVTPGELNEFADKVNRELDGQKRSRRSNRSPGNCRVGKSIALTPRFLAAIKNLSESDLARTEQSLRVLPGCFGKPHQHLGLSIRRMRKNIYECRAGLKLRILFRIQSDDLEVFFIGAHDEVKRLIRDL